MSLFATPSYSKAILSVVLWIGGHGKDLAVFPYPYNNLNINIAIPGVSGSLLEKTLFSYAILLISSREFSFEDMLMS